MPRLPLLSSIFYYRMVQWFSISDFDSDGIGSNPIAVTVDIAQLVECQIVALKATGSNPVIHTNKKFFKKSGCGGIGRRISLRN